MNFPSAPTACLLLLAFALTGCEKPAAVTPPPPTVEVMTLQAGNVPITDTWVGTLTGDVTADIRAQVSGYLQEQVYQNGAFVKKGDVLFQIDPRPFEASLDQAKGSLAQAQAQLTKDDQNAKRSADLYSKQVISLEQYQDQLQAYEGSKAAADAAAAAVQTAQLNLDFTRIISPIDGLSSIATAQVGDLVGPSTGTLATVISVNPIKVKFSVAEQEYLSFIKQFFADPSKSPVGKADGPNHMELTLALAGGTEYPETGKLTAVDNVVTQGTGSLSVEGLFPNPGNLLRPGQFGLVTAITRIQKDAILVPQRAVIDLQGTNQIAVVGANNKVNIRNVTAGPTIGSDWLIESGLQAGDKIVVEGVQKVREGMVVNPTPYKMDAQEEAPIAAESEQPDAAATTPLPTPAPAN